MDTGRGFSLDTRLLFFEIGTPGCVPVNFVGDLAFRNRAKYLSPKYLFSGLVDQPAQVIAEEIPLGLTNLLGKGCIDSVFKYLSRSRDVMLDAFVNSPESRTYLRVFTSIGEVALVALDFSETPEDTIINRLRTMAPPTTSLSTNGPVERIVSPTQEEEIDIVIRLDGCHDTGVLIARIEEQLDLLGLFGLFTD